MQQLDLNQQLQDQSQREPIQFTVKPTGEFSFNGIPDPEIVRELLTSSDYQRDQQRRAKTELEQRMQDEARIVNVMTIGFLGTSFLVCILCAFLSIQSSQSGGINNDRELIRGVNICQ
jgi:hypothetical protein